MYLGVIRDEERVRAKAEEKARLATLGQKAVTQPASVVDEDCATCVISPPPQLLEAQSKEERARERQARLLEYEQQKGLAQRLETTQGKGASTESARLV